MNQEDRYHTTSWDGRQVQRQGADSGQRRPQSSPGGGKKKPQKKRSGRMNPLLSILIWVVVVASSSVILAGTGWKLASDFAALDNEPKETVKVEVKEEWIVDTKTVEKSNGTTTEVDIYDMDAVADMLKEKGLIKYPWFFKLFNKVYHGEEKISAGTFELNTEMDYMALIRSMRPSGRVAETVEISIPEGFTVQQIIDLLAEKGVASAEDLTDVAANFEFQDYSFLDPDGLGDISRLEGYLYPDTYQFYVGGKAVLAIDSMLKNFNDRVFSNGELTPLFEEMSAKGYDLQDIITIASLIEEETDGTDRGNIASVIYNRLENAGETAYLLQIDAALVYAAGRPITQADYAGLDSPYNLYQHTGLPPTPIANPGLVSIKAALQPNDTNYYFYVLGEDGKHIFSETLAQHQKNLSGVKK